MNTPAEGSPQGKSPLDAAAQEGPMRWPEAATEETRTDDPSGGDDFADDDTGEVGSAGEQRVDEDGPKYLGVPPILGSGDTE